MKGRASCVRQSVPAAVTAAVTQGSLSNQAMTYAVLLLFGYSQSDVPKVTKRVSAGEVNWAGGLGITLLPLNRSQKSTVFSLMGELLNVVLASEAESVGSPCSGSKRLKPGAAESSWCGGVGIGIDGWISIW